MQINHLFLHFRTIRRIAANKASKELLETEESGDRAEKGEGEASIDRVAYRPMTESSPHN